MKNRKRKWDYKNLNKLIDMVAHRAKREGVSHDASQLSLIARREISMGYYYGYAKAHLPKEQVPKSLTAVHAMLNWVVSYQKPEEVLARHKSSMKFNAKVIIQSRFRLQGEHDVCVVERNMAPNLRHLSVA